MYEAMARRYRPRTFGDVVGQEHVAQTLRNAIATSRVAHAYLFCGPHGCGKTSMARIFASALVCEKGPTPEPCGECDICRDVLRGQDMDVQEIDGASNNGVEQVRALREQAGYIPSRARFKIYIIDEVHMLSVAAFNALLKTLEEPPAHVKFILATTDPHKILGTILSRCQRFDFRLVPPPKMAEYLKKLTAQENAEITDEALDAVAAFSGGSVRDGLVLLDQLVSYAQGKVTREDVERVRGVAGAEAVAGVYEAILSHDLKRALRIVDEVAQRGTNTGDFLDQLIEYGRDVMIVIGTGAAEGVSAYGPARKVLLDIANSITLDQSLLMLDVFAQARTRVRSRALSNPLVPLEMAVARLCGLESLAPLGDILLKLNAFASGAPLPEPGSYAPAGAATPVEATVQERPASPAPVATPAPAIAPVAAPVAVNAAAPEPVRKQMPDVAECASSEERPPWEEAPRGQPETLENARGTDTGAAEDDSSGDGEPALASEPAGQGAHAAAVSAPAVGYGAPVGYSEDDEEDEEDEDGDSPALDVSALPGGVAGAAGVLATPEDLGRLWREMKERLAAVSPADNSLLADVSISRIEGDNLYLLVPGGGSFIFEQLEDKHRKGRIAACAQEILKRQFNVHLELAKAMNTQPAAGNNPARERGAAVRDPGVRLVLEHFEGEVLNVEEGR